MALKRKSAQGVLCCQLFKKNWYGYNIQVRPLSCTIGNFGSFSGSETRLPSYNPTQYLFVAKQKLFLTLVTWTGLAIILTHSEPGNSNLFNYIITMSITHHVFPGTLQLFTQF